MHPLELAGLVVLLALVAGGGKVAADAFLHHTLLNDDGTVTLDGTEPADPAQLAADAHLSLDEYSLARMIYSEAGGLKQSAKTGVAWAAMNWAARAGRPISTILLRSSGAGDGYYGKQSQGRYASTARDPNLACISTAVDVIAGDVADPTGGAIQWDSPRAYSDPGRADEIAAKREAEGKVMVTLDDVDPDSLRFWSVG